MYALQNKQPIMKSSSCIDWQPHRYNDRSSEKRNAHQVLSDFFEATKYLEIPSHAKNWSIIPYAVKNKHEQVTVQYV